MFESIYVYIYIYIYVYIYMYIYIYLYVYLYTYIYLGHTYIVYGPLCLGATTVMFESIYVYIYICMYIYIYVYMYVYLYVYLYTYKYLGHTYIVYGPLCLGATTVMFESIPTYPNPYRYMMMFTYNITVEKGFI
jgi:acyl-coenzyme A synthetase/AMP-(fatty) acid ligase